ncbi:TonB-dependent receptor [Bacteroidales bacterium OttesenSCG-928-C19]|nr:TonB-dependent receptor [Bacteroidales bacterium OttesenSCG-928-C19]
MRKKQTKVKAVCFRRWTRASYAVFSSLGKTVKIGVLGVGMLGVCQQSVLAQKEVDTLGMGIRNLDDLIVSEERPEAFQPIVEVVAVLTQKDVERAAVQNLSDLLTYLQGVDIRSRNKEGVQADISLRGGTFDQVAILLNGINFTDPQTGHFNLNLPINFQSIERIEVLQGPGAWSAGNIAFSGAINIITKTAKKQSLNVHLSGGSHDYSNMGFSGTAKLNRWEIAGGLDRTKSIGYIDNTDFDIFNAYSNVRYKHERIGNFELQAGYQRKEYGANSFYSLKYPNQFEETQSIIGSLRYLKQIEAWRITANIYYRKHHDRFELFRSNPASWYKGHNYHVTDVGGSSAQVGYASKLGVTTVGADWRSEHIYSNNIGKPADSIKDPFDKNGFFNKSALRQHFSISAQHALELNRWNVAVGIMGNGNNDYGTHLYAGGNISYKINRNWKLGLWANNAYRLPTFTDLYYSSASQQGNKDLKPEKTFNSEINISGKYKQWQFRNAYFFRYGYEIIDWVRLPSEEVWHSENLRDVKSYGVDLSVAYRFENSFLERVKLDYSWLQVDKKADQYLSLYATDYLKNQLKLSLDHHIWKNLSASWFCYLNDRAGSYLSTKDNTEKEYEPYILCDLKLSWRAKYYTLYAEANNLFNTKYFDFGELPQAGRWLKVGVQVNI